MRFYRLVLDDAPKRISESPVLGDFVDVIPILRITLEVADPAYTPASEAELMANRQGQLARGVHGCCHRYLLREPIAARRDLL